MQVILLEDVKTVGKKGEIVEVSDAFGRNVLLRKKQAVEANNRNRNDLKLQNANAEKVAAQNLADAQELGRKLENAHVTVKVKTGEGGRLFGSISSKEVADAIKEQLGFDVDKKKVLLTAPLKTLGEATVNVKLHTKVTVPIKVDVQGL